MVVRNRKKEFEKLFDEAKIASLMRTVTGLDTRGRALILKFLSGEITDSSKLRAMSELRGIIAQSDEGVRKWISGVLPEMYTKGMNRMTKDILELNINIGSGKTKATMKRVTVDAIQNAAQFAPERKAVNALLADAYLDFGSAMSGYVKGAERILNTAIKRQVRSAISEGAVEGKSIQQIKKALKDEFADQGFTVLISRSGNEWSLGRYAEMLSRTHIIKAANEGAMASAAEFEVDIVEISSHGATDSLCQPQEGKVYSLTGKSSEHPYIGDNAPPYHPNCAHGLIPRPDLEPRNQ